VILGYQLSDLGLLRELIDAANNILDSEFLRNPKVNESPQLKADCLELFCVSIQLSLEGQHLLSGPLRVLDC
jgi:hypothetical protein